MHVIGSAQYRGIPNFPEVARSIIRQDWASSGGFETIKYGNQINSLSDLIHDESRKSKTIHERFREICERDPEKWK